jgi:tripartite-type tricarboxylate transporter receptor subunit TctC
MNDMNRIADSFAKAFFLALGWCGATHVTAQKTIHVGGPGGSPQKLFQEKIIPAFKAKTGTDVVYNHSKVFLFTTFPIARGGNAMTSIFKIAVATLVALSSVTVYADTYPNRSIRLVVPFAAGGTTDNLGRLIATRLSERLGQPVVVDNRSGAGGNIGTDLVAKSPADGYTLLLAGVATQSINVSLYKRLPFDPQKDFTAIAPFASVPNILVVNPKLPVKTVSELIAHTKNKPNSLFLGSAGSGTTNHLSGELFKSMTGSSFTHVPYKGSGPAMADLLANQVQLMFDNLPGSLPHVKSGAVRALAVTSAKRSPVLPEVPTMAEAGVPGYVVDVWFGLVAPKNLPKEVLIKLSEEIAQITQEKGMVEKLATLGATPLTSTPAEFAQKIQNDTLKWAKIVRESGATVD